MRRASDTIRFYDSAMARKNAIHQLAKRGLANYFVPYRDVQSLFALQFGLANWLPSGQCYIDGGWYGKRPVFSRPWAHQPFSYAALANNESEV